MDIQEAYKQLNLDENASNEKVESQYMKWIRRYNASQRTQDSDASINIDLINEAYNTITNHRKYGSESPAETDSFRDKLDHFFRYYKLHTIGAILLIIITISIISGIANNYQEKKELASLPPSSLDIMFYGSYINSGLTGSEDTENILSKNILAKIPEWERINTIINFSPVEINSSNDIGIQQKSAALLVTEKPDMYIMDLHYFEIHVPSGMFQPLDQLVSTSSDDSIDENALYYAETEINAEEHLYGVEITDDTIFDGVPFQKDTKKIAAIRKDAANKENAMKLILNLSKANE